MSQANVERVRSAYEAANRRDIEALKALAREHPPAPGFEFESVLTGQVYRGTQEILDLAADVWETVDYAPAAEEFIDAGDHVVAVLRISGRGARSGVPVTQRVGIVWTFEGETLVRGHPYLSGSRPRSRRAAGVDGVAGERGGDPRGLPSLARGRLGFLLANATRDVELYSRVRFSHR